MIYLSIVYVNLSQHRATINDHPRHVIGYDGRFHEDMQRGASVED